MYKRIVFSIGGSIVVPGEVDVDFVKEFSGLIKRHNKKCSFSIVVGGGKTARTYAGAAKALGLSETDAHNLGIAATQINAKLIALAVGGKFLCIDPVKIGKMKGLSVSGGYKPGHTTDTDAALIAKSMKADAIINVTDVKGVYTKNPKEHADAEFLAGLNWKRFFEIVGHELKPSGHYVFDPIAAGICQKNKIKVVVLSKDLHNIENFLDGKDFIGTIIS